MAQLNSKKSHPKKQNANSVYMTNKRERMKYYGTKKWWRMRHAILCEEPLCVWCLDKGVVSPAEDVHHIVSPFSIPDGVDRAALFYDIDNIIPICKVCHGSYHSKFGRKNADGTFTKGIIND